MVAEQFWIRGVNIDTRVENDEEQGNPDNVVIGEMTGLATSTHHIRVNTGAGDDSLQVTGLICNEWTYHLPCLFALLGTGINTLSFQGMNPDRVRFPTSRSGDSEYKVFVGIHYDMRDQTPGSEIHLRMKDSESSTEVNNYKIGYVVGVNVFHGSPLDDTIVMGDDKSCVVKNDGGNNMYVIFLHNEHDFTHTIIDNSETIGKILLVWRTRLTEEDLDYERRDVAYDEETQTLVVFMRTSGPEETKKHTFIGRIIIKRTKPGDVKEMQLSLVQSRSGFPCRQVPILDEANLKCRFAYTLGHLSINRGIGSNHRYNVVYGWNVKDRPVPSIPFHYKIDTDIEANPIPDLCGDFIITLDFIGSLSSPETRQFSLRLPTNSFLAVGADIEDHMRSYESRITIYYLKSDKKLIYQIRYYSPPGQFVTRSVELHVPEAKRIVFGTTGNLQLLLDLKHDDRPAVNLRSECVGLISRPVDEYNFARDYTDSSTKPKQIVLGSPSQTPSDTKWTMTLGTAKTYDGITYGELATGNYAENALIVAETLWAYLSREGSDMSIAFTPTTSGNKWKVAVKKGSERIHAVVVAGANTLAYHEKLFRINLYDLVNGAKETFDLYEVWKEKRATLESDIISEANICI